MRRATGNRETYGKPSGSSIPRPRASVTNRRRSSSADCVNRGSYLPSNRRTSSVERFRTSGSAVKHPRQSPRGSAVNLFNFQRGSLLDRKGVIKDHRPLNDRAFQKECVISIVEYLEENKFPFSITPANMMPPSKKDFEKIFQFLYQMLDPKYEVHKLEDEAPKLLKSNGYPYMINKSAFLTINRMSWPTLLGALVWLKDLNKISSCITLNDYLCGEDFSNDESGSILLNYVLGSFGVDDEAKDEEVFVQLVDKKYDMDFSVEEIEKNIEELKYMVEKEKEYQNSYLVLVDRCKELDKDIQSYEKYLKDMEVYLKQKTAVVKELKEQKSTKEQTLNKLREAVAEKDEVYKAQGYDAEHAKNFYKITKTDLVKKLECAKKTLKEEEKVCWDLRTEIFGLKDNMDGLCRTFGPSWEELRNTIENIRSALISSEISSLVKMGKNFKITLPDFQLFPACIDEVRCILEKVKSYIDEQMKNIESTAIISIKDKISELEMAMSDLDIKEQMMSAEVVKKEREVALKIEDNHRELENQKKCCDSLEQKLSRISDSRSKVVQDIESLKNCLQEKQTEKEAVLKDIEAEREAAEAEKKRRIKIITDTYQRLEAEKQRAEQELIKVLKQLEKD